MSAIIKANKTYRNILFTTYGFLLIAGFVLVKFIIPQALLAFRHLELHTSFKVAELTIILFFLMFAAPSIWLISIGKKIVKHDQDPYPGMKVIFDTEVLSGKKARLRGKIYISLGYICLIGILLGSMSMHRIFIKITTNPILVNLPLIPNNWP
jgi:hypothetical protein